MKVNLNVPFNGFNGRPIVQKGKEVIMAETIGMALFGSSQQLGQKDMLMAYDIIRKLQTSPSEVQLASEEITFLKETMAKVLTVGCYGQLYDVLENNN